MAMRDLVTGAPSCAPGSSSNPLGAFANVLTGSSSKTQERLKEIPTSSSSASGNHFHSSSDGQLTNLPGSESDYPLNQHSDSQDAAFLHSFRAAGRGCLAEAWDEINNHPERLSSFPESGRFHNRGIAAQTQPSWDGPPQKILSGFLHSFVDSSRGGVPFRPTALPVLGLTKGDKQCVRDRSSIMARHFFADKSEDFINAQVDALLCSLDIAKDIQMKRPLPGMVGELEEYWNEAQGSLVPVAPIADGWVAEYGQHTANHHGPNSWVNSFEQEYGSSGWASEFEHEQAQMASLNQTSGPHMSSLAAMEQTRMLAHTMAQNNDPKFQNSKFLQFVSKMSRGELFVEDNQVKASAASAAENWTAEFQKQHDGGLSWADQFSHEEFYRGGEKWVSEFTSGSKQEMLADDKWVDEFSKLNVQDWVDEFGHQAEAATGEDSVGGWANAYDEYLSEQSILKDKSDSSKGVYVFSDMNPYVGHPDPLKEGQELFKKGLLSEAVLALEAEVLKNPDNAEGWRLLGIAHAENDDDQLAISSMMKAQEVDPTNLEVLLALGVSHTNELEQTAALKYLYQWLHNHPKYGALSSEQSGSLYYADVARVFSEAAQMSPEDADVHIVLGVLYNLSREYDKAIESFKTAIKLKPQDYSLWNKLGATQANSVQSADAIAAYQQALDLKPNYVRAWANMGISYANQGMYEESIRYYVRALSMNPKADNAWQYLRISLSCASRNDMLEACDARNLDVLQKEFPL